MKNFRFYRIFKAFMIIGFLTMVCFFAFASEDRHVFASNLFLRILADLYVVFQFPAHTFLFGFFPNDPYNSTKDIDRDDPIYFICHLFLQKIKCSTLKNKVLVIDSYFKTSGRN